MSWRAEQRVKLQDYKILAHHYDLFGRRISKNDEQYGYNVRDELISANDVSYNYDDIGNRTTAEGKTYTANNLNQYTAIDDFMPQYDDDGNQTLIKTETGIWSVTYNAENRPIRWQSGDTVITMSFDRMGRRVEMRTVRGIEKQDEKEGSNADSEEIVQRFVYDNYLCIQQLRGADNTLFHSYVWDPTEPIATRPLVFLPTSFSPSYYFHNGNKNVSDLAPLSGTPLHYDYTTFGTATAMNYGDVNVDFSKQSNMADLTMKRLAVNGVAPQPIRNLNQWMNFEKKDERSNDGVLHLANGGSWYQRPIRATSSIRWGYLAWMRPHNVGFRVVVED